MDLFISPKKIIVRMPNWIGDCTMATAALAFLREKFPKAHITAMIKMPLDQLLENNPYINEIFPFVKKKIFHSSNGKICKKLQKKQFDLAILLTNSFSSTYLFKKAKIPFIMGYENFHRKWFIDYAVQWPKNINQLHIVDVYKNLLSLLGKDLSLQEKTPQLFVKKTEITAMKKRLQKIGYAFDKPLIILHPGASYGPAKRWLFERYQQLAEKCEKQNFVVFVGDDQSQKLFCDSFINNKKQKEEFLKNPRNWMGKTSLRELTTLLSLSSVTVSSDSGPMHMAAAVKKPVIALFGPTNPVKSAPYGGGIVIKKKEFCSPCFQKTCKLQFRCMKNIQVDEVFQKIQEVLQQSC